MPWKNNDTKTRSGRHSLSILEKHTFKKNTTLCWTSSQTKPLRFSLETGPREFSVIFNQFVYMI